MMSDAEGVRTTRNEPNGGRQHKRKTKRGGVVKKFFRSPKKEHKLLVENMCVRSSWLVQCSKFLMSCCQVDSHLYQECYTLFDAVRIIQIHHPDYQCTTLQCKQVKGILSESPLRNIGQGSCIFVAASKTPDGGGWVLESKGKNGRVTPPKSRVLASYLPLEEDMDEAAALFSNAVVGFMIMPTLYMSKEATPSEFATEIASDDRVILEGHLVRFDTPFSYPDSNSVKMDGGQGGYFRMLLGDKKAPRYKGIRKLVAKHGDYIDSRHQVYKARVGAS